MPKNFPVRRLLAATACWLAMAVPHPASADDPPDDPAAEPGEPSIELSATLTVTDTRLRDRPVSLRRVPAHVTVVEGERIRSAAADSLQELLAAEAGVVVYDQVGNDLSRTFDLRGFTGGGVKVFLDGAPLNDPRSNALSLELVPLAALERIEITRGSSSALAGGGSEAGVVNLFTRRGDGPGGRLALAAGDFDTLDAAAEARHRTAAGDLFASLGYYETEGHRENAGGDLLRAAIVAGRDLGDGRRLQLSLVRGTAGLGNPGALTFGELAADRQGSPFNRLDFTDERSTQAVLSFAGGVGRGLSLAANLQARDVDAEILTTGRAAPAFGGFWVETQTELVGAAAQLTRSGRRHELTAGLELQDGETAALGVSTPPRNPDRVDRAGLSSDNTAGRRTAALFVQETWTPAARWTVTLGGRWDDEELDYEERFPVPSNDAGRTFSEVSLRTGAVWAPAERWELFAAIGEAFLPPTPEELFSFPRFGSNPGLEPEDSRSVELGLRRRWDRARIDASLFQIDTENEIVFDPDSPLGLFGANVNGGEARRRGIEAAVRGRASSRLRWHAALTLMDAELTRGEHRGNDLPLVPRERLAAGLDLTLPAGVSVAASGLRVGEQALGNDEANAEDALAAYTVVGARLTWAPRAPSPGGRGWLLFVEADNLFDERYATRGIFAFDFSTFTEEVFLTPAPGRRVMAGVEWRR